MIEKNMLINLLSSICSKANIEDQSAECTVLSCVVNNDIFLIAFASWQDKPYAKVVPLEALVGYSKTCVNVFYSPWGLYVFSEDLKNLIEKIKNKIRKLKNLNLSFDLS